jgi:hypothetical protein
MNFNKQNQTLKCGFCDKELDLEKDIDFIKHGFKRIVACPYCNAVLGIYTHH